MSLKHRRSELGDRAMHKVEWLRARGTADPEVVETLDTLAETLVRLDARIRATEGKLDAKLAKFKKGVKT